jgi:Holliday junction resolvase RusA-like endonuclease
MMWIIQNFPMSLSQNDVHAVRAMGRSVRILKTRKARIFDNQVILWKLQNKEKLDKINREIEVYRDKGYPFRLDIYFAFAHSRLWTKDKRIKILDVNNFLKSAIDGLCKCICLDDKLFFSHFVEKVEVETLEEERIIFKLTPSSNRTLSKIMETIDVKTEGNI